MKDISLRILDMECAACVARLDRALEKLPGVQRAAVNYTAASALITYDERVTDLAAIAARAKRAGFRVPVEEQDLLPAEADAETAAAAAAALCLQKTAAAQRRDDALQILFGYVLALGDVHQNNVPLPAVAGKVRHDAQRVASLR